MLIHLKTSNIQPNLFKVSRMGEWLIIQERVGLLTTQNGTQQIHEKRIRINEEDLMTFCEQDC